jgi:hypothetical protein
MRLRYVEDVVQKFPALANSRGIIRWLVFHIESDRQRRLPLTVRGDMRFYASLIISGELYLL